MCGGEHLVLLPDRAVWWPARRTLIASDLHLGKSQTLRAGGSAVPAGVLGETLGRLDRLIASTGAERLLVVGDLLHAGVGLTAELVERVASWRRAFGGRVVVVPGNHDRALPRVAQAWGIEVAAELLAEDGLAFCHEPCEVEGAFVWAGHVHPAVTLAGGGDRVKLPCFVVGQGLGLLPAFTRFSAGGGQSLWEVGARILAIAEGSVVEVGLARVRAGV